MKETTKPEAIFKFDYMSYGKTRLTPQITAFRNLKKCFPDVKSMTKFMEIFVDAVTTDFGLCKSFYDAEKYHDDEDQILDDPSSKTIPLHELTGANSILKFISVLKKHKRSKVVTRKFVELAQYLKKVPYACVAVEALIEIIKLDGFFIIKNKDSYPVVGIEDQLVDYVLDGVIFKNFRKNPFRRELLVMRKYMQEYSMHRLSDTHTERRYHHKMVGMRTDDGGLLLVEESKKRIVDETTGFSINFIGLPSSKKSYNYTGVNMWESICSESKIRLIRCLVPEGLKKTLETGGFLKVAT